MELAVNGCRLNVEILGPEDGPVLIAHHGGGGIGSLAEPKATFGTLADRFRVIVFDARGCGLSEAVPPYSHAQWAADVDALREWAGAEKIVIAGGSYGGFIAMEYALAYPEHVSAIVLRDTSPDNSDDELAYQNARTQTRVALNWENFERYWSGNVRDDEDLKALWAELIPLYDFEYDAVKSAAAVEAGIYRHDWVCPLSSSETIARLIPRSELVIFEKSGHSPQKEEPEKFQRVMREFLDRVVPAGATV